MARYSTYFVVAFIMMMWGFNVVAIKVLIEYFPPIAMQGSRVFLSGIIVLLFIWMKKYSRKLTRQEWINTVAAGFLGITCHHFFLALGLQTTTASNAGIILALIPLTTSILAVIYLKEKLTKLRVSGIFIGFVGVLFVILTGSGQLGGVAIGDMLIFLAMVTQAFSFIIIKKTSTTLDSRYMTGVMLIAGALFLLLFSPFVDSESMAGMAVSNLSIWIIFLFSAVFATGIGQLMYNGAIQKIGPGKTTIFNNLMPFFALLGSVLFIGEVIHLEQIIGFIFIVTGVILGTGYMDDVIEKRKAKEDIAVNQ